MLAFLRGPFLTFWWLCTFALLGVRVGEAATPGPQVLEFSEDDELLCIGVGNPDGLASRVDSVAECPWGLWGFAETQMTHQRAHRFAGELRRVRKLQGREAFVVTGSDIPRRTGSVEAGAWSGVALVGHFPVRAVHIPWPDLMCSTGRVLLATTTVEGASITGAVLYGFCSISDACQSC